MELPEKVVITEVGTRDGFQIEPKVIPTSQKLQVLDALARSGLTRIEAASFVRADLVPQMADAEKVMAGVRRKPNLEYIALVLNGKGAERALAAGADALNFALSASETHNLKNAGGTVDRSFAQFEKVMAEVWNFNATCRTNIKVTGIISTSFGCPFEGQISEDRVLAIVERYLELGADEVNLADTTGIANPRQVKRLAEKVLARFPDVKLGLHFHNTRGMGLANVIAGLEAGVTRFDSSIGGLGGCPFAPGATGNICTEDLVHMLEEMGIQTGINLDALIEASHLVQEVVGHELPGQVAKAGKSSRRYPVEA